MKLIKYEPFVSYNDRILLKEKKNTIMKINSQRKVAPDSMKWYEYMYVAYIIANW